MRILVTWGSKHGGTEGIARILGDALEVHGYTVVTVSARDVTKVDGFDAAIIGGALYANRWPGHLRRFVHRHEKALRKIPVWLFSSGPLDDSADHRTIPAPTQVAVLAERIGAKGHVTFGGRLEPDVRGFPASAMANKLSGDWRNPDRIRAWAAELAVQVAHVSPNAPVEHPAHSLPRLLAHGLAGWVVCAAIMAGVLPIAGLTAALIVHAFAAPLVFGALAWRYFHARGARDPLPTAVTWAATVAGLDLLAALLARHSLESFGSIAATWLPFALIFVATWAIGGAVSTLPWPERSEPHGPIESGAH